MTSPCVLCAAHHRAASQEHVDLLRRRRRCRLRRRDASMLLALLRVRRRPVPRADRARLSRAPVTTVTSPCLLCDTHHRATARELVDLPRRRRRRRPRCRSAATLLVLDQASAPARAPRRARAPLARLCRPVTSTRCSASAMRTHRATARYPVDFPCRRRRCRPRRCCASTLLAPLPARRRFPPLAEPARRLRASITPVTSLRCSASAKLAHRAPARSRVDLPCRRRRCRPRRRSVSALLAPWQARRRLTPSAELARRLCASTTP